MREKLEKQGLLEASKTEQEKDRTVANKEKIKYVCSAIFNGIAVSRYVDITLNELSD